MKLFTRPGTCSLATDIALREAAIPFELVKVSRHTGKTSDGVDFNEINSKGYVPALVLDSGEVLTENAALLQYIADLNPAAKLAPPVGTLERYRLSEWLAYINSEIHKAFSPLFMPNAPRGPEAICACQPHQACGLARGAVGLEAVPARGAVFGGGCLSVRGADVVSPCELRPEPVAEPVGFSGAGGGSSARDRGDDGGRTVAEEVTRRRHCRRFERRGHVCRYAKLQ